MTYFNNKINIDIFHVLTDGKGAIIFLKEILYNYLNLKHKIKNKENKNEISNIDDLYLKYFNKKIKIKKQNKKVFLIKEKYNLYKNKTYHYILNLEKIKKISKKNNTTITEFLTAIYIYAIYKTNYNKLCNKDIIVTIPINLRKYYNIESLTNFFTCMRISANVINNKNITFNNLLKHIHNEFENKLTKQKINEYLARDVKLGTNIMIKLVPLFIKKTFMKYLGKLFNQTSTTTLSNVGSIEIEDKYKKYIDNIMISVKTNKIQKIACTVSSYNNKLTITLNSNLISNSLEKEFYNLLKKYIGNIKIYKSM